MDDLGEAEGAWRWWDRDRFGRFIRWGRRVDGQTQSRHLR